MGWGRVEEMNGHLLKGPDDKAEAELNVEVLTSNPNALELEAEGSEMLSSATGSLKPTWES